MIFHPAFHLLVSCVCFICTCQIKVIKVAKNYFLKIPKYLKARTRVFVGGFCNDQEIRREGLFEQTKMIRLNLYLITCKIHFYESCTAGKKIDFKLILSLQIIYSFLLF